MLRTQTMILAIVCMAGLAGCQSATHIYSAVPFGEDSILISAMAQPAPGSAGQPQAYVARCRIQPNQDLDCKRMPVEWVDGGAQ